MLIFNLINSTFMSGLMTITCPNRERKAILASSRHAGFIAQHCLYWNSHYWNPHLNSNQHLNTNIHTNSRHIGDQYPSKTSLNTPVVRHTGITRKTIKTKICTIKASAVLHYCKKVISNLHCARIPIVRLPPALQTQKRWLLKPGRLSMHKAF